MGQACQVPCCSSIDNTNTNKDTSSESNIDKVFKSGQKRKDLAQASSSDEEDCVREEDKLSSEHLSTQDNTPQKESYKASLIPTTNEQPSIVYEDDDDDIICWTNSKKEILADFKTNLQT